MSGAEGGGGLPTGPCEPGARPARGPLASLLAIALGLEAAVLFFATLVAFGLRVVDPVLALVGGAALLLVFVLVAGAQRWRAGVIAGGVLQVVLIATGALMPVMFLVGGGFAALWLWCLVRGRRLETQRAAVLAAAADPAVDDHPTERETP
ncbi:MAG: DUF4233 domain-containing protein [Actinomycetales bacterium]|nr:DUF4233 domain-containing protein [Actinomycetales bacterium]